MRVALKEVKQKTCKSCGQKFKPHMSTQKACSVRCALDLAPANQDKAKKAIEQRERAATRARKEKLKTAADYARDAQSAINRYVRLRDANLGCISCDKTANWNGQWHCSHFRSVGAAPHLRFNLWNMNKSCSICNNFLSGNIGSYRKSLIEKIGLEKVIWLENNQSIARHDIQYMKRIKSIFSLKAKRLERKNERGFW